MFPEVVLEHQGVDLIHTSLLANMNVRPSCPFGFSEVPLPPLIWSLSNSKGNVVFVNTTTLAILAAISHGSTKSIQIIEILDGDLDIDDVLGGETWHGR